MRTDPRPLWAIASKQEDRYNRLVVYRAGWIGLITRLCNDSSVHWPEILPAADGDDPRITTYRIRT
ncbi:hypothetical protein OH76DRAFT_1409884 [Lentinus brumalis]|uniref:Uncharacterized protein n=1 Tax=Lentinus brumalis TaxID=2498619 RepID=A0A371CTM4_9APHY|nr:hypothetical protein OH76DRAFT_1409884 [Polyporus brumalis]